MRISFCHPLKILTNCFSFEASSGGDHLTEQVFYPVTTIPWDERRLSGHWLEASVVILTVNPDLVLIDFNALVSSFQRTQSHLISSEGSAR